MPGVIDRLAWVTARTARGRDRDEPLALAAFAAAGVHVDVVDWDDPEVRWASYDRVALRSTWDYSGRLAEFRHWLGAVGVASELVNPVPLVRWNLDKHYLAELDGAGVPTIPTVFAEPGWLSSGGGPALPGTGFVVKPAVGAGSRDVAAYRPDQHAAAREHVDRLHARGATAMLQPMLESVPVHGEWPLVFLGGRYSHAANKRMTLPPVGGSQSSATQVDSVHTADAEQLTVAGAAIEAVSARVGTPAYARVDLVRDDRGRYLVLELELVEPSLFLSQGGPDAVERLVSALAS